MMQSELMKRVCAFGRGNCAAFTVNNISRENITIRDLEIDGGLTREFAKNASSRCGLGDGYVSDPCPPCTTTDQTATFTQCGWNNFGILIWDYNMPERKGSDAHSPRNIWLSGLHIHSCSMGLHVLGTTNFTLEDSTLERNGNGNAYFHNAYFLRVVGATLRNTTFQGSTGHVSQLRQYSPHTRILLCSRASPIGAAVHCPMMTFFTCMTESVMLVLQGLKITQQNQTLITNCTVADNIWQGIWVGSESKGNWDLQIIDTIIERNHMYGIQLSDTNGFEIRGCIIRHNPNPSKAGLMIGSNNGLVTDTEITENYNNLVVKSGNNVTLDGVTCEAAFLYPLCADSGHGFMVRNTSCKTRAVESCVLPESPF
jgi:hypothetical protein